MNLATPSITTENVKITRTQARKFTFSFSDLPVARERGVIWSGAGIRLEARGIRMLYKKINVELIVIADEAEAVVTGLNAALDRLEEKHTLFGGGIETVAVEHSGTGKRSALAHTMAAGETAVRAARESLTVALRAVI
jgi:hypothetical protein